MDEKKTVEALRQIKQILEEHNVEFWLSCGVLLGAVREKKIIPWDHDIDLATWDQNISKIKQAFNDIKNRGFEIYYSDFQQIIKILKEESEIEIALHTLKDNKAIIPVYMHNKIGQILDYINWTLIIKNPKIKPGKAPLILTTAIIKTFQIMPISLRKNLIKLTKKLYQKIGCKKAHAIIPSHFFTNLSTMEFYEMKFKAPKDAEGYLSYIYGKDWRTPKKDYVFHRDDNSIVKE